MSLTPNSITTLINTDSSTATSFQPIVQIINIKTVGANNERYRLVLSDGQYYVQGMLATQINRLVTDHTIKENTTVCVKEYITNQVQGRVVVIVLALDVVQADVGSKIGNPIDVAQAGAAPAQALPVKTERQGMYANNNNNSNYNNNNNNPYNSGINNNNYGNNNNQQQNYAGNYNNNNNNNTPRSNNPYSATKSQINTSSAPIQRMAPSHGSAFTPITGLNMYMQRWTIKARITAKSDIRTWSNARGEGSLFSIDLLDESGQDIRATFFKEAVDRFYNMLVVDKVYTLSGGKLKAANMKFNTCKSGFEITFDENSEIHLVHDDGKIEQNVFEFIKVAALENIHVEPANNVPGMGSPNSVAAAPPMVDLLVVVKSVGAVSTVMSKRSGQELFKCDLVVVDDSATEANLTLWGEQAKTAETQFSNQPIVAFKKLRVSDYGGRSLGTSHGGNFVMNPSIPECDQLRNWWQTQGSMGGGFRSISSGGMGGGGGRDSFENRKTISAIKDEGLGTQHDKADWISFKATMTFLKKDKEGGPWYTACSNAEEPCKNRPKVNQTTEGTWHCDKCNRTSPNCVRRFIFSACVTDDTSTTWVSIFDEQAQVLLGDGVTADSLFARSFEGQDTEYFESVFANASNTDWIVKAKVRTEFVSDEQRVKVSVAALTPVDYVQESRDLIAAIQTMKV